MQIIKKLLKAFWIKYKKIANALKKDVVRLRFQFKIRNKW